MHFTNNVWPLISNVLDIKDLLVLPFLLFTQIKNIHFTKIQKLNILRWFHVSFNRHVQGISLLFLPILLLSGCATTAPTVETYTSYRVYTVASDYSLNDVRDAVVMAAKEANENAAINNGIPPHPLPEKPGRFVIKNMQMGPISLQFPQTPGATISIRSSKNPGAGESMNWVIGIYPFQGGYSVQMVMTARYQRGVANPFNPVALGAALGREMAYKQSGGIEVRIKHWFDDLAEKISKKVPMKLIESYPNV